MNKPMTPAEVSDAANLRTQRGLEFNRRLFSKCVKGWSGFEFPAGTPFEFSLENLDKLSTVEDFVTLWQVALNGISPGVTPRAAELRDSSGPGSGN